MFPYASDFPIRMGLSARCGTRRMNKIRVSGKRREWDFYYLETGVFWRFDCFERRHGVPHHASDFLLWKTFQATCKIWALGKGSTCGNARNRCVGRCSFISRAEEPKNFMFLFLLFLFSRSSAWSVCDGQESFHAPNLLHWWCRTTRVTCCVCETACRIRWTWRDESAEKWLFTRVEERKKVEFLFTRWGVCLCVCSFPGGQGSFYTFPCGGCENHFLKPCAEQDALHGKISHSLRGGVGWRCTKGLKSGEEEINDWMQPGVARIAICKLLFSLIFFSFLLFFFCVTQNNRFMHRTTFSDTSVQATRLKSYHAWFICFFVPVCICVCVRKQFRHKFAISPPSLAKIPPYGESQHAEHSKPHAACHVREMMMDDQLISSKREKKSDLKKKKTPPSVTFFIHHQIWFHA